MGQRNAALNLTKTANLFRETSKGAPVPAPPTPIAAFRTAINIRECREMHIFRPSCSHLRKHRGGLGHRQRAHLTGTGSSNYGSHWCLGTFTPKNGLFNLREIHYCYQRHFCSARGQTIKGKLKPCLKLLVIILFLSRHILPNCSYSPT